MTEHTKTISNSLQCLGLGYPTIWNSFLYGTGVWGEGSIGIGQDVVKALPVTYGLATSRMKDIGGSVNITLPIDLIPCKEAEITVTSTFTPLTFETSSETLSIGIWDYVFTKPSTNAEDRTPASFTSVSTASGSWTSNVTASTVWS